MESPDFSGWHRQAESSELGDGAWIVLQTIAENDDTLNRLALETPHPLCGFGHEGEKAVQICLVCKHPQAYLEMVTDGF